MNIFFFITDLRARVCVCVYTFIRVHEFVILREKIQKKMEKKLKKSIFIYTYNSFDRTIYCAARSIQIKNVVIIIIYLFIFFILYCSVIVLRSWREIKAKARTGFYRRKNIK